MRYLYLIIVLSLFSQCTRNNGDCGDNATLNLESEGYTALYGHDLSQWKGQIAEDPREIPGILEGMRDEERAAKQREVDRQTFEHWYLQDGMILYDGTDGVGNIETRREFGDFELVLDWKIGPKGDSGIFPRNMPQVQIWDPHHQGTGSGGLYNNKPRVEPLSTADKPVGEWNRMRIRMVADSIWVTLNGVRVVDGAVQDNLWADYERPAPARGPIVLQSHDTPLWFRNIYIRELD